MCFRSGDYIYWTDWWNKNIERTPISADEEHSVILGPVKDMEDLISFKVNSDFVHCKFRSRYQLIIKIRHMLIQFLELK